MTDQIEKAVADVLQHLDKATPEAVEWVRQTSEWMMGVWIKQITIVGIGLVIGALIVGGLALLCFMWFVKADADDDDEDSGMFLGMGIVLGLVGTALFFPGLLRLINPEYYALQKWLQLFGRY